MFSQSLEIIMIIINCLARANKLTLTLFLCLISSNLMANKAHSQASISSSAMFMNGGTTITVNDINTTINIAGTTTLNRSITTTTTGVITTISAESILPNGLFFDGNLVVSPTFVPRPDLGAGVSVVSALSIGTTAGIKPLAENVSFNRAASQTLINAAAAGAIANPNLELIIGIIRAGAGINGLD